MQKLALGLLATMASLTLSASAVPSPVPVSIPLPNYPAAPTTRDGRNDFNFEFGTWRTHYRLLKYRLVGSHEWYDCYGTSVIRPFWGGGGNLEDGDLKCPNRHIGGMTVRFYNARTHQWTLWWGTRKLAIAPPPQIGHYDANGVGNFYAYDSWQGKPEITRFQWTVVNGNPHFEQAYSTDGGKTWETNWTTDYERVASTSKGVWNANDPSSKGDANFSFLLGSWRTHSVRVAHPLSGDRATFSCDGTSSTRPFWGGHADLEDGEAGCPAQSTGFVTMRLYDAASGRWLLYSATQSNGLTTGLPAVGRFDGDAVADFYQRKTFDGRSILVRDRWLAERDGPRLEEAYSADAGKTWETEVTTQYRRRSIPG